MELEPRISYKLLREINPAAARLAVLEYLKTNGNISKCARIFGINRCVIYSILAKQKSGDLSDRSKRPHSQPQKTAVPIEKKVIETKNKTRYGPKRLSLYLQDFESLTVPAGTIRHILRRNKDQITYLKHYAQRKRIPREFIDWYQAKPFEIVQIDLKEIRDHKALSGEQMIHLDKYHVPNYQLGALDVNSRFKLIGYSREKTWTNGLLWYLWVISWLRTHGIENKIVFTVDNGEEFGGRSWMKVKELRTLIKSFNCRLIQNHKGHFEENAHLERSHRTDDDEFYIPRCFEIKGEEDLCHEGANYIYYYNNLRRHSSLGYQTPFARLKQQLPNIDDRIKYVLPIMFDKVAVDLGPWSRYNVLAQNPASTTFIFIISIA